MGLLIGPAAHPGSLKEGADTNGNAKHGGRMYKLATIPLIACGVLYSATSAGAAPATGENGKRRDAPGPPTGSVQPGKTDAERMRECMATWDPGTHMTKQQWRRTCRTLLRYP